MPFVAGEGAGAGVAAWTLVFGDVVVAGLVGVLLVIYGGDNLNVRECAAMEHMHGLETA